MNQSVYWNLLGLPCYTGLAALDEKNINYFDFNGKTFIAKPCHFYDGDTFSAIFEHNGQIIKYRCRCVGYDTAEIKPRRAGLIALAPKVPMASKLPHVADKTSQLQLDAAAAEKKLAQAAKTRFVELVTSHPSGLCLIQCGEFDKYGRLLVTVFNGVDKDSINSIMIKESHGKAYSGGTKDKW